MTTVAVAKFERAVDSIAPAALLALGVLAAAAMALVSA